MAINKTAFNIDKTAENRSVLTLDASHNLPEKRFRIIEKVNGVVTRFRDNSLSALAKSVNGEISCETGPNNGDITAIYSRRHPRQHFDMGALTNSFVFCDTWASTLQEIYVGRFILNDDLTFYDAVLTMYKGGKMYALVYGRGALEHFEQIDPVIIARYDGVDAGFDATKGHYISTQSNGDIIWYFSSPYDDHLYEIHRFKVTNKKPNIVFSNAALHIGFLVKNLGAVGKIRSWYINSVCEGDLVDYLERVPFGNAADVTSIPIAGKVLFALDVKTTINGRYNTRDIRLYNFILSCTKRGRYRAYVTRYPDALTKGALQPLVDNDWTPIPGGSGIRYIDNSSDLITNFNTTDALVIGRAPLEANVPFLDELIGENAPEWLVHGEKLVIMMFALTAEGSCSGLAGELM